MGFRRAEWHSGLTYCQTCDECGYIVMYTDKELGFRLWFTDGFVYCPRCKKPLRHKEEYAIDAEPLAEEELDPVFSSIADAITSQPHTSAPAPAPAPTPTSDTLSKFCSGCGKAFLPEDRFCPECGKKRN